MKPPKAKTYAKPHLPGVLFLCREQGWSTYVEDAARTHRALTAPGTTTLVAVIADDDVVGVVQIQGDGQIQAHVSLVAVAGHFRRQGIGRELVIEALRASGCVRADLVSEDDESDAFYSRLPHRRGTGFRIYPPDDQG